MPGFVQQTKLKRPVDRNLRAPLDVGLLRHVIVAEAQGMFAFEQHLTCGSVTRTVCSTYVDRYSVVTVTFIFLFRILFCSQVRLLRCFLLIKEREVLCEYDLQ